MRIEIKGKYRQRTRRSRIWSRLDKWKRGNFSVLFSAEDIEYAVSKTPIAGVVFRVEGAVDRGLCRAEVRGKAFVLCEITATTEKPFVFGILSVAGIELQGVVKAEG